MRNIKAFISVSLIVLLSACGEKITALKTSNVDNAFSAAANSKQPTNTTTPPTAVTDALVPNFNDTVLNDRQGLSGKSFNPSTFSISVHEVDAREFFMSLVVDSHENMVVHPDVNGHISLELKNVNVNQVLNTVKKVYGYDYAKTDIGYIVYPATLQTKIFKVDRLDMVREGVSSTRVTSGQVTNNNNNSRNNSGGNSGNNSGGNGNSGSGPNSGNNSSNTSGSSIITSSKTDFWEELEKSLSAIVDAQSSQGGDQNTGELQNTRTGSKVVINKQTGMVVVRANPSQMREVEQLITGTQNQIGRQVIIEAKILEVILNDSHRDGINWASVIRDGQFAMLNSMTGGLPAIAQGVSLSQSAFTLPINAGDFTWFIELLEGQGKTNILSSPRISSLNNQKAVIKVGQDEYFITDVSSSNTVSAGTTTPTQDITWTPFFSGVALDVTPQIADSEHVTLHIHPSVTRVAEDNKTFTINDQPGSLPLAKSTVRESDSVVHALNNQIIVIGGLMQTNIKEDKVGLPFLDRIPFLGNGFRENSGTGEKSELVILLKPTIINSEGDWREPVESSRERIQQLERTQMWK